jgi:hypothetical protein
MTGKEELRLPQHFLNISVKRGNECGWKQNDVLEVIEAARKVRMAIIGGQVQYLLPIGRCELYWLSYDSTDRNQNEEWINYCDRTADEVSKKFQQLLNIDIQAEAIKAFPNHLSHNGKPIDKLKDYQVFILYFEDMETGLF